MPGVPKEMKAMFTRDVLPHIAKATGDAVILSHTLHTFGLGESNVGELLHQHGDLMRRGRNPSVGTTVSGGIVSLRVNGNSAFLNIKQRRPGRVFELEAPRLHERYTTRPSPA